MTDTKQPEALSLAKGADLTPETWADFAARLHHGCRGEGVNDHYTADAVFLVQKREKSYLPEDVDGEDYEIYSDSETYSGEEWYESLEADTQKRLDAECEPKGFLGATIFDKTMALNEVCPEARLFEFNWRWDFVGQHFTKDAADAFIKRKKHDYRDGLRVYVDCSYYSWELNAIKDGIMDGRIGLIATPDETSRLIAENAKLTTRIAELEAENRALKEREEAIGAGGVTGLRAPHSACVKVKEQPYAYTSTCKCGSVVVAIAPQHFTEEELAMEIASWNARGLSFEAVKKPAEIGIQQCRCAAIAQEGGK